MDKQQQDFKTLADQARIIPPKRAWDKLEDKLDFDIKHAKRKKSRILNYLLNTTALAIILLACTFIYQETKEDPTVTKGNIAEWEDLELNVDHHYDIKRIHSLTSAYKS